MNHIAILGEGAWGTAIATLLARNGHTVKLWCHDPQVKSSIEKTRSNMRYLPDVVLDSKIIPVTDIADAVTGAEWIFEAIPVKFLRSIIERVAPHYKPEQRWVILSKGIEQGTLQFPSAIIDDVIGFETPKAVILGPSYAHDVAHKQITAVTIAATDCAIGQALQALVANNYFRPYLTRDIIGVQVGAAFKNVIALGVGMLDGAGLTDNAQALLVTRGLHEMVLLADALGGRRETIYGLAGVGDLVLTAMGSLSKNREVGRRLGQGKSLAAILQETGYIPEGINTLESVIQIAERYDLDLPIMRGIHRVVGGQSTILQMLEDFMSRPLEHECPLL